MDLRQLRYFQAVAHARSLSSAAERLGMAQPPLGRQIRALEEALGVTLVLRSQRGVTLTEVGRNFLARTDDLLRRMDEAIEEVREIAKGGKGQLSIGLIDEALAGHIAQKVTAFASSNRDIGVITTTDSSASLATQVNDQTLDAAVIFGPPPAHLLDITFRVIDRAPLGALVSAHHPAVAAGHVHLADLGDETFVIGRISFTARPQRRVPKSPPPIPPGNRGRIPPRTWPGRWTRRRHCCSAIPPLPLTAIAFTTICHTRPRSKDIRGLSCMARCRQRCCSTSPRHFMAGRPGALAIATSAPSLPETRFA